MSQILKSFFKHDGLGNLSPVLSGDNFKIFDSTTAKNLIINRDLFAANFNCNGQINFNASSLYFNISAGRCVFASQYFDALNISLSKPYSQIVFGCESNFGQQIILAHDTEQNFDHPIQTNTTLYIQSITDPDTDNTQWGSLAHDQTDFILDTGKGYLSLGGASGVMVRNSAGANLLASADTERTGVTSGTFVKVKDIQIPYDASGTLTVTYDHKSSGSTNSTSQIYVNGVPSGTSNNPGSTSYVTFSEDISGLKPGDNVQLYYAGNGGSGLPIIRNFRLKASIQTSFDTILD